MISILKKRFKKLPNKSFFDYSAKEQKSIIKRAARGSNELQRELVKRYAEIYAK